VLQLLIESTNVAQDIVFHYYRGVLYDLA